MYMTDEAVSETIFGKTNHCLKRPVAEAEIEMTVRRLHYS